MRASRAMATWLGVIVLGVAQLAAGGDVSWRFQLEQATTTPLSNPHDIKLSPDRRHLYVSDVGTDRVVVLDAESLQLLDAFGEDQLDGTHDIDIDAAGRLYVADTHNGRVVIFEMDGTAGTAIGALSDRISGPEGVLVHPNGLVYVAGAWSNNVVAFRDGRIHHELRGLSAPHDLELGPDGQIWLADAGNDRILLLNESLEIVRELSGARYAFNGVRYLDVLSDGTLVAADKYMHSVKFIDPQGHLVATLGTGRPGRGEGRFRTPEGVDSDGDRLWFADSGNDRVVRYRLYRP